MASPLIRRKPTCFTGCASPDALFDWIYPASRVPAVGLPAPLAVLIDEPELI